MTKLTYQLLLDLYAGKATVVELLESDEIEALRIDTPVAQYLAEMPSRPQPRHVFLTGNAGDGKTFAAKAALKEPSPDFCVIHDASDRPVDELVVDLSSALESDRRLVVAINRGQLERLCEHVSNDAAHAPLRDLLGEVTAQLELRPNWSISEARATAVAVVDLGLVDSLSHEVLTPVLERAATAVAGGPLSPGVSEAFACAVEALTAPPVRKAVVDQLQRLRGDGVHVTMRQLWSLIGFLMTGGAHPLHARKAGLSESLGARLFDESVGGPCAPLIEALRRNGDPAAQPQPALALAALTGVLSLSELPGVGAFAGDVPDAEGRVLARAACIHGWAPWKHEVREESAYLAIVKMLRGGAEGWLYDYGITTTLLRGVYRLLGLSTANDTFPAWQRLAYASKELLAAAAVAARQVDHSRLMVALPRPSPDARAALGDGWAPPFVLVGVKELEGSSLRLSPSLFQVVWAAGDAGFAAKPSPHDAVTLWRWLTRLPTAAPGTSWVRVSRGDEHLVLEPAPLGEKLRIRGQT